MRWAASARSPRCGETVCNAAITYAEKRVGSLSSPSNESHAIARPLVLHVPTADHFVPPEEQKAMHEGLDPNPHVTLYDYEGLDHGFAAEGGSRRNEAGARLADGRTEAFFAENLGMRPAVGVA